MKLSTLFCFSLLMFISFESLQAQNDQDAMMKAWTAYMTPSDVHKMIAKADGQWDTEVTLWMDPNGKPVTSKGTCVNKMILGGRYQESTFAGNFMNSQMEGKGILGYDNAKKIFQSTWIDNMGTGIMNLSGPWDDATKTINLSGVMIDPISGKDMKVRETLRFVDDKNQIMEMFIVPEGANEFKSMEIKFVKK